jgi:hypothetical protein
MDLLLKLMENPHNKNALYSLNTSLTTSACHNLIFQLEFSLYAEKATPTMQVWVSQNDISYRRLHERAVQCSFAVRSKKCVLTQHWAFTNASRSLYL